MKKGFTLSEVLFSMIIISVIATLSIPAINRTLEMQHKQAYKAVFQQVNNVVNELINDRTLYPIGEFNTAPDLCNQFFNNFNTIDTNNCSVDKSFTSLNGMKWEFVWTDSGNFSSACPDSAGNDCIEIRIDVNGNKGSNTYTSTDFKQRDILRVYVSKSGRVYAPEDSEGPERSYLTN